MAEGWIKYIRKVGGMSENCIGATLQESNRGGGEEETAWWRTRSERLGDRL